MLEDVPLVPICENSIRILIADDCEPMMIIMILAYRTMQMILLYLFADIWAGKRLYFNPTKKIH
jgi:hypothetical protein